MIKGYVHWRGQLAFVVSFLQMILAGGEESRVCGKLKNSKNYAFHVFNKIWYISGCPDEKKHLTWPSDPVRKISTLDLIKSSQTFIVDTTVLWSQVAFSSKISNFHHIQTSGRMDRPTKKWGNLKCPWQGSPTWNEEEWWWMEALKATFPAAPLSRDLHFVKSHATVRIRMIKWPTSKKQKETFILSHFLMQDISKADALNGRTINTFKMFFFIFLLCFPMQDIS